MIKSSIRSADDPGSSSCHSAAPKENKSGTTKSAAYFVTFLKGSYLEAQHPIDLVALMGCEAFQGIRHYLGHRLEQGLPVVLELLYMHLAPHQGFELCLGQP